MKVKSVREINILRTKILVGDATAKDRQDFLYYVSVLELALEEAGDEYEEFNGAEWESHIREKW